VEARVEDAAAAGGGGAGAPVGADGAEPHVVLQVAGQHPPPDQLHQVPAQRRPIRGHLAGAGAGAGAVREAAELAAGNHGLRQISLSSAAIDNGRWSRLTKSLAVLRKIYVGIGTKSESSIGNRIKSELVFRVPTLKD